MGRPGRAEVESGARTAGTQAATWPNFFVVGAPKAGTSAFYAYLEQHPQVYMSPLKEPHYFSRPEPGEKQRLRIKTTTDQESYLELFKQSSGAIAIGEASSSYLWNEQAPYRIREQVPDARIIILLRDPIERAFSHYLMNVRQDTQYLTFYEALEADRDKPGKSRVTANLYVEFGQYASQVERYLELFGPERVQVFLFEDLKRDPAALMRQAARFLGLDEEPVADIELGGSYNAYALPRGGIARAVSGSIRVRNLARRAVPQWLRWKIRDRLLMKPARKPKPEPRAVEYLRDVYAEDVERLEALLGRPLPELRRSWEAETG